MDVSSGRRGVGSSTVRNTTAAGNPTCHLHGNTLTEEDSRNAHVTISDKKEVLWPVDVHNKLGSLESSKITNDDSCVNIDLAFGKCFGNDGDRCTNVDLESDSELPDVTWTFFNADMLRVKIFLQALFLPLEHSPDAFVLRMILNVDIGY